MKKIDLKNKKVRLFLVLAVCIVLIGGTYAYWRLTVTQTGVNEIASSCFGITLANEQNDINLQKAYPISDEEGMSLTPYTFTITNNCDTFASYSVNLELLNTVLEENRLSADFVKVMLDENTPLVLNANTNVDPTLDNAYEAYELTTGYLDANESVTYNLRLWMDGAVTVSDDAMNKNLESKVVVTASYVEHISSFSEAVVACEDNAASCLKKYSSLTDELVYDDTQDYNLRYIGADPNNYVDIGDKYGEGATREKWKELGSLSGFGSFDSIESPEQCDLYVDDTFSCSSNGNFGFSSDEECSEYISLMLEQAFGVSSVEAFKNTYCVLEDISNEPILWRIIGVFNNIDNGSGTKETRLKIIRDEPIGNYSWDYDGTEGSDDNDWTTSTLMNLLNNGAYYNRTTGNYYNHSTTSTSVDFSTTGLTSEARSMIDDDFWHLGRISSSFNPTSTFYTSERGTTVYSERPTEWTGQIGLMYPSDYGYATSGGSTGRDICLSYNLGSWSDYSACRNNDWLYDNSNSQWTLTSPIDPTVVFTIYNNGRISMDITSGAALATYPVSYLLSSVKIVDGDGTRENPFVIE